PEIGLASGAAALRLHPGWRIEARGDALRVQTGVRRALLVVSAQPRPPRDAGSLESRAQALPDAEQLTLDDGAAEPFEAGGLPGVRIASAGTLPEGERGWFEFHLIEGPSQDLLLRYRCPVLSGSIDARTLARCAASARFGPSGPR